MGEKRKAVVVIRQAGNQVMMKEPNWIVAVLFSAFVIEVAFRMMNRFSKESGKLFRWVYIIGGGIFGIYVAREVRKITAGTQVFNVEMLLTGVVILVLAIVFTVIINFKKDK
jgi:hypothetical protein